MSSSIQGVIQVVQCGARAVQRVSSIQAVSKGIGVNKKGLHQSSDKKAIIMAKHEAAERPGTSLSGWDTSSYVRWC